MRSLKISLTLSVLFFSSNLFAQVKFNPSQQIIMSGGSCAELDVHASSLKEWLDQLTRTDNPLPECFCSSKSCQMDVASISPFFIKQFTSYDDGYTKSSAHNGPNCFNAALIASGTQSNVSFTHPFEMTAILHSSLCRERGLNEPLAAGDVLAVRDQKDKYFEIHAGVYINDQLSFSKYGQNNMMPYSYGLYVEKTYGVLNTNCRRIEGTPREGDECYGQRYVNFFSCEPIYTFVSRILKTPQGLDESAQKIYAETTRYDLRISNVAYKGQKITEETLIAYQESLLDLSRRAKAVATDPSLNDNNKEFVFLMRNRVYSLYEQLNIIAQDLNYKALIKPSLERP